jgi:hypothetical protein
VRRADHFDVSVSSAIPVRGFLAGTVRKMVKLNLFYEPGHHGRIYRLKERRAQSAKGDQIGIA